MSHPINGFLLDLFWPRRKILIFHRDSNEVMITTYNSIHDIFWFTAVCTLGCVIINKKVLGLCFLLRFNWYSAKYLLKNKVMIL